MDTKAHWEQVYSTSQSDQVSWFEETPWLSLQLLDHAGIGPGT